MCRPISDLEKTLAALVRASAAAASATPQEPATTEADNAGACQAAATTAAAATPVTEVTAADTAAAADPLESDSIQELLEHMSALETLAVPAVAPSSTSACSSPSGRRTPGSTCRTPAPRSAAATAVAEDAEQRKAIWEQDGTAEEVAVGPAPCSPAAASAGGARCISHGLELRISSASKDGSSGGGAELPARLSYAAAAAPHSPHVSSAGCASPKAVCRITQFAAVSASVSQCGQASNSEACSRTDSGIV
jgi:hypothetical protein